MLLFALLACHHPGNADDTVGDDTNDTVDTSDTDTSDTDTSDTDTSDTDDTGTPPSSPFSAWDPSTFATVYDVGPGYDYADPNEVPWESIGPSTLVRIHYRDEPYATKWVVNVAAAEDTPVVVLGVRSDDGKRPRIVGGGATTRQELDYWGEDRAIVKVGGSSLPNVDTPSWVWIQGLDITGARGDFTDDAGNGGTYAQNAAAVWIERGQHVTIEDCELSDAGNGLFVSNAASDVVVRGNSVHGNGNVGSAYEHNSYTEALGITFEFNHYGALCDGCDGNSLKDRSGGTVIRYNWIEGGNRQLDLVESDSDTIRTDPRYRSTYVYGNVLVEPDGDGNSQIVHYGGDGGDTSAYRKGTLYFYDNTVVSWRTGNTTLVRLSTSEESADVRNDVLWAAGKLAILEQHGSATLGHDWLSSGWTDSFEGGGFDGNVDAADLIEGTDPGFADRAGEDFHLADGSAAIGAAGPLADGAPSPVWQYLADQRAEARDDVDDVGAFGR